MSLQFPLTAAAATALVIIVASEVGFVARTEPLTGLPIFQPTADDASLVVKRRIIPRVSGEVLLIGDSSCMMDLDPAVLARAGLGHPLNLGSLVSFTLPGFATLAEEALSVEPAPRAVVIAVLPRSFEITESQAREFSLIGRYLTAYSRRSQVYDLYPSDRWSWFFRKHRLNTFPPELGGSFDAFAAEVEALNGHYHERGMYPGPKVGEFKNRFEPTEYSRAGFVQLAEAVRRRGLPIVFWWSPSPSDAVSSEYLANASRYVEKLKVDFPALAVARTAPGWEPRLFGSVTHLTPAGAQVNSQELADYLRSVVQVVPQTKN